MYQLKQEKLEDIPLTPMITEVKVYPLETKADITVAYFKEGEKEPKGEPEVTHTHPLPLTSGYLQSLEAFVLNSLCNAGYIELLPEHKQLILGTVEQGLPQPDLATPNPVIIIEEPEFIEQPTIFPGVGN